jgi:hypothetical protein
MAGYGPSDANDDVMPLIKPPNNCEAVLNLQTSQAQQQHVRQ